LRIGCFIHCLNHAYGDFGSNPGAQGRLGRRLNKSGRRVFRLFAAFLDKNLFTAVTP
jgi:hypothetical protein